RRRRYRPEPGGGQPTVAGVASRTPVAPVIGVGARRGHTRCCRLVFTGEGKPRARGLMMRVFVGGATGAIGKQLVPRLVAAGHEVHGMTRSESKKSMLDALGAVPVVADALDPDQVAAAVGNARPDVIVHQLTAIGSVDPRPLDRG